MSNTNPKIPTTTPCKIPDGLPYLRQEARKCKGLEHFIKVVAIKRTMMQVRQVKRGIGSADELIGGISQTAFSTDETKQRLEHLVTSNGFASLTDFYNQARN